MKNLKILFLSSLFSCASWTHRTLTYYCIEKVKNYFNYPITSEQDALDKNHKLMILCEKYDNDAEKVINALRK